MQRIRWSTVHTAEIKYKQNSQSALRRIATVQEIESEITRCQEHWPNVKISLYSLTDRITLQYHDKLIVECCAQHFYVRLGFLDLTLI